MGGTGSQTPQEAKQEFRGREGCRAERLEDEPRSGAGESPGRRLEPARSPNTRTTECWGPQRGAAILPTFSN